jgi:septal ring factor EnvC (AmiA/AmiB activator)
VTPLRPTAAIIALLLASAGAFALPARAQDGARDDPAAVREKLQALEGAIATDKAEAERLAEAAAEQARRIAVLRAEMQAAARAVQSHERAIAGLEDERVALAAEAADRRVDLAARREQLGGTLAALQRIALRPPAALLVGRGDPNDVVRSGLLMRAAIPQIEARADALRVELAALAALDTQLAGNRVELEAAAGQLAEERRRLAGLVDSKQALFEQTQAERDAAAERVARLTKEARSLGDLLDALMRRGEMHDAAPQPRPRGNARPAVRPSAPSRAAVAPPSGAAVSKARGRLTPPADGELVVAFGDATEFGAQASGVTWRVRPGATVLAPWDGQIVFAGPFRHFGRILIIDHGEGYHSLIAGMARIEARAGQWVLAGEPVGMAGADSAANDRAGRDANGRETADRSGSGVNKGGGGPSSGPQRRAAGPTVYVEFRRNGQPINPLPWLAASLNRTNG